MPVFQNWQMNHGKKDHYTVPMINEQNFNSKQCSLTFFCTVEHICCKEISFSHFFILRCQHSLHNKQNDFIFGGSEALVQVQGLFEIQLVNHWSDIQNGTLMLLTLYQGIIKYELNGYIIEAGFVGLSLRPLAYQGLNFVESECMISQVFSL